MTKSNNNPIKSHLNLFESMAEHHFIKILQSIDPLEYPWLLSCLVSMRQVDQEHFNRQWQFLLTLLDQGQTSFLEDQARLLDETIHPQSLESLKSQMTQLRTQIYTSHALVLSEEDLKTHLCLLVLFFSYAIETQTTLIKVIEKIALVFEFELEKLYEWQREFDHLLTQHALQLVLAN
jgi:hypothetical protein